MKTEITQPVHTKGEWKVSEQYKSKYYIVNSDNEEIIKCEKSEEGEANAQRIVKAVNMHEQLIEGLKTDVTTLEHLLLSVLKGGQEAHVIKILKAGIAHKKDVLKQAE